MAGRKFYEEKYPAFQQNIKDGIVWCKEHHYVKFEDDIPNDYYPYLAGMAGKMLRKKMPLQADVPSPK